MPRISIDGPSVMMAAFRGSPWRHDIFVLIIFVRAGIRPPPISREVYAVDLVPTLAGWLAMKPSSGVADEPLFEALNR